MILMRDEGTYGLKNDIHLFSILVAVENVNKSDTKCTKIKASLTCAWKELRLDFISAYGCSHVAKWSLWWALGTCGNFQVKKKKLK